MLVHFGVNVALKKHAAYMFMKIHLKPTRRTAWWLWNSMQASLGWLLDLDLNSHRLMSSGVKIPWALTWKVVTLRCLRPQATELPELCCLWTNTSQRGVKQIQATGHAFVAELLRRNIFFNWLTIISNFPAFCFCFPMSLIPEFVPVKSGAWKRWPRKRGYFQKKITLHHVCWCTHTQILSGSMLPSLGCCDDSDGLWKSPRDPGVAAKQGKVGNWCNKSRSSGTQGGYSYIQRLALDSNLGQAVKHHLEKT